MTTKRRIYFITSNWEYSGDPSCQICYWDETLGKIVSVNPNLDFGLGAGWLGQDADGSILVSGARYYRYVPIKNIQNYGSWWDNTGPVSQENLTEDVILYRLNADLRSPEPLFTDLIRHDWDDVGWPGVEVTDYSYDFNNAVKVPYVTPEGDVLLVGWRGRPSTETDFSEGEMLHRYSADGVLIKRELPHVGETPPAQYDDGLVNSLNLMHQWSAYDVARQLMYYLDGWGIWRYDLKTGETRFAPKVYPQVQTFGGYTANTLAAYGITTENALIQGPLGHEQYDWTVGAYAPAYSYVEEGEYWRSRRAVGFAVDQRTGLLWALVHGYEPSGQEYAVNGTPLSEHVGGFGMAGEKWQLLCLDFERLVTVDTWGGTRDNPYPHGGEGEEFYNTYLGIGAREVRPTQAQADVQIIDITHGPVHVALAADDPARPGWGLARMTGLSDTDIPALNDYDEATGTTLAVGSTLTFAVVHRLAAVEDATGTQFYVSPQIKGPAVGAFEVSYTGPSGTHVLGTFDSSAEALDYTAPHPWGFSEVGVLTSSHRNGFGSVPMTPEIAADLVGGVTITLTHVSGDADLFLTRFGIGFEYLHDRPAEQQSHWDFKGGLALPPDDPGYAYYSTFVPHGDNGRESLYAYYRISLDTGRATEVFRDDRHDLPYEGDPDTDLAEMSPFQILVTSHTEPAVLGWWDGTAIRPLDDLLRSPEVP